MFLTSSRVSHFVDCKPYSKSVSIKFSGFDTRSLDTGSVNVSSGANAAWSASMKICNLSLSAMPAVVTVKISVVVSASGSNEYDDNPSEGLLKI